MVVILNIVDTDKYQFFSTETIHYMERGVPNPNYPNKYYFLDKETKEIFSQKIFLQDYRDKEFLIHAGLNSAVYTGGNGYVYELSLMELKQANKENRLSGKLKELVDTLDEMNDNNVFMLVEFK